MSTKRHIMIVEDEADIGQLIQMQLSSLGHQVTLIADGQEALEFIQTPEDQRSNNDPVDLFILDRMLPGVTGLEICKFIRMYKKTKTRPILMVTALTSPEQIVEGLDAGADDYITKPFDLNVLTARVRSLMRRVEHLAREEDQGESGIFDVQDLKVDTVQCKAWVAGEEIDLTLSEYKLLCTFLQEPGKVMTRNQLVQSIQDGPVHVTDRTIDTHIFGLRKKLKHCASLIETIRGIGYRVVQSDG
jgi:two-component system, OmpR family, phosphate regulon response regulator PhoB